MGGWEDGEHRLVRDEREKGGRRDGCVWWRDLTPVDPSLLFPPAFATSLIPTSQLRSLSFPLFPPGFSTPNALCTAASCRYPSARVIIDVSAAVAAPLSSTSS